MQARVQYRAPAHALVSVCTSFLRCRKGRGGMGLDTRCTRAAGVLAAGCRCAPTRHRARPTCYVENVFFINICMWFI